MLHIQRIKADMNRNLQKRIRLIKIGKSKQIFDFKSFSLCKIQTFINKKMTERWKEQN